MEKPDFSKINPSPLPRGFHTRSHIIKNQKLIVIGVSTNCEWEYTNHNFNPITKDRNNSIIVVYDLQKNKPLYQQEFTDIPDRVFFISNSVFIADLTRHTVTAIRLKQ